MFFLAVVQVSQEVMAFSATMNSKLPKEPIQLTDWDLKLLLKYKLCVCVCVSVCVYVCVPVYICTYLYTFIFVQSKRYTYTQTLATHIAHTHTHVNKCTHILIVQCNTLIVSIVSIPNYVARYCDALSRSR